MAPALLIASAAIAAYGAIAQGRASAASEKSAQNAADYNATVNRDNAQSSMAAASANEQSQRRENAWIMGRERASVGEATGGFAGTSVGVLNQNGTNLELSALNTRYGGLMQGRALLAQSRLNEFQGQVAGMNARSDMTAGYIGAASSALSGVAKYQNYNSLNYSGYTPTPGSGP